MKLLRAWMDERDCTQAELGKSLDVTQATVSDWLNGVTSPSFDKLGKIAKKTHIPIDKLVADCAENVAKRREERQSA